MIKYVVWYCDGKPHPFPVRIEIVKETPKRFYFPLPAGVPVSYYLRANQLDWTDKDRKDHIFDTWEEAHACILAEAQRVVAAREESLRLAREHLATVEAQKKGGAVMKTLLVLMLLLVPGLAEAHHEEAVRQTVMAIDLGWPLLVVIVGGFVAQVRSWFRC